MYRIANLRLCGVEKEENCRSSKSLKCSFCHSFYSISSIINGIEFLFRYEITSKRLYVFQFLSEEIFHSFSVKIKFFLLVYTQFLSCERNKEIFVIFLDIFLYGTYITFIYFLSRFSSEKIHRCIRCHKEIIDIFSIGRIHFLNLLLIHRKSSIDSLHFLINSNLFFFCGSF